MDVAENAGGASALVGAPSSPIVLPSHHSVAALESQPALYNGRKCEKVIGLDVDVVLDKTTEPLNESSLASELDMFDIELQKEFQAASLRSAMPSAGNNPTNPNNTNAGIGTFSRVGTNYGVLLAPHPTGAVRGARVHPEIAPPTVAPSDPGKRFSSVAGAYQLSMFTQDVERSMHLIHLLAQDIRREMQIVGNVGYSSATGQTVGGGGSAKSGRASPAAAASLSSTFAEDLRLVTTVVQDINQIYHLNPGSPSSPGGGVPMFVGGGGGAAYPFQTGLRGAFPRTSPAGGRSSSCNGTTFPMNPHSLLVNNGNALNNNNGRSTIDTEVNDSLRRIGGAAANSPSAYHDYEVRPVNPSQAAPHGLHTLPQQAPQTQYPSSYFFSAPSGLSYEAARDTASRTPTVVHHLEHITLARPGGPNPAAAAPPTAAIPTSKKALASRNGTNNILHPSNNVNAVTNTNNNNNTGGCNHPNPNAIILNTNANNASNHPHNRMNSTSQGTGQVLPCASLAYPLAVKPRPGGRDGRNRGPRSRSGKNVAPSNYSAFSECSGGETRSYKSTTTTTHPFQHASSPPPAVPPRPSSPAHPDDGHASPDGFLHPHLGSLSSGNGATTPSLSGAGLYPMGAAALLGGGGMNPNSNGTPPSGCGGGNSHHPTNGGGEGEGNANKGVGTTTTIAGIAGVMCE